MLRISFALLLLASACTRAPASTDEPPIPSECKSTELSICVESCRDPACLEWCAGESCAATLASLTSCMEQLAAQEHAFAEHWAETCQPICVAQVVPPRDGPSFCDDWRHSAYASLRRSQSPERSEPQLPSRGTSMWLVGELAQRHDDPHVAALIHMINRGGWPLDDLESCVPDLDQRGREFVLTLELDQGGAVRATEVRSDEPGGECIANAVASALALPVRVARDYPRLDVRVRVEPLPNLGDGEVH